MPSKYIKHPRAVNTKYKCNEIFNRSEPRKFTASDACRISRYAAQNSSEALVAARVLSCLQLSDNLCQAIRFGSAGLLLIEAVGEIAAVTAVGVALEKAYRLLMGAASKVPQIRIALAGLIVAIIFMRAVIGAIEAMIETSAGVREALDDLVLICELAAIDNGTDDAEE